MDLAKTASGECNEPSKETDEPSGKSKAEAGDKETDEPSGRPSKEMNEPSGELAMEHTRPVRTPAVRPIVPLLR